jgi:cyclophilin family peptidyl-prolyl cis-trans isomerase
VDFERHDELTHVDGAVGMAREFGDKDSASSQFYICDGPQHRLDDNEENNRNRTFRAIDENGYAVFGVTVKGIEVVREIARVWTTTDIEQETVDPLPTIAAHVHDHPMYDVTLRKVTIVHHEAEDDDPLLTVEEAVGLGALVLVAIGAIVMVLLNHGRLQGLEPIGRRPTDIRREMDRKTAHEGDRPPGT